MVNPRRQPLGKLPTSIPGLDGILSGGIPELSINIITQYCSDKIDPP